MKRVTTIGIAGAGAMGAGIAQVAAETGFTVFLLDVNDALVTKAVERIRRALSKSVEKGKLSPETMDAILNRINPTSKAEDLKAADIVIEAIFEDISAKMDIFKNLENRCAPDTIFASNTSTLSITGMAARITHSDRFVGLHFFNPVPSMRLVEVIPALQTSADTVAACLAVAKQMRKIAIKVVDCPGFLVNRIFLPYAGEAMLAAQEGAALPGDIDAAVKQAGFPMGPLALNDMVGIDVGVHSFPILYEGYGDRFPVPILFKRLADVGRLGLKTNGKGIYNNGKIDEEFHAIIRKIQDETKVTSAGFSADRLILRQVNEAVYCLQENVASPEDIDRAMALGTGFPCDANGLGGPLRWADEKGLDWVLAKLNEYKETLGHRFWPHPLLKQYVAAGYLGKKTRKGFFEYPG